MKKLIVAFAAALLITACGDSGSSISEQVLENQPGVSDVQIGDNGSSATIQVEEDGASATIAVGGAEIPEDFPIPLPDGGETGSVIQSTGPEGQSSGSVVVAYPAERWDEILAFYQNWAETLPPDRFVNVISGASPAAQIFSEQAGVSVNLGVSDDQVLVIATTGTP